MSNLSSTASSKSPSPPPPLTAPSGTASPPEGGADWNPAEEGALLSPADAAELHLLLVAFFLYLARMSSEVSSDPDRRINASPSAAASSAACALPPPDAEPERRSLDRPTANSLSDL